MDGTHYYISIKFPLYDLGGACVGTAGIATDITERKRAEEDRAALQQQIIDLQRTALNELSTPIIPLAEGGGTDTWARFVGQGLTRTIPGQPGFAPVNDAGGEVLLDQRVRPLGSHHQKLVVVRHPARPQDDVAFVGGIDLAHGRRDSTRHEGDPQRQDFADVYGERPAWHDVQVELRGPA
ncbi:MAG: hypothetical protein ACLGI6_23850, partial [Gammaproteobacteria bacterium]